MLNLMCTLPVLQVLDGDSGQRDAEEAWIADPTVFGIVVCAEEKISGTDSSTA